MAKPSFVAVRPEPPLRKCQRNVSSLIANGRHDYYLNDSLTTNDLFTSALGNNLASCKLPSAPMASLPALLSAYDLDAGDVIHVDTCAYRDYRNVLLTLQDSGVRIEGPGVLPAGQMTNGE